MQTFSASPNTYQIEKKMGLYLKLTFVSMFTYASLFATTKQLNYIDAYKHIAIQEMERTGIPASIKLAQALLESGAGVSYLAREANNHFGIKCGRRWDGEVIYRKDDDYDADGNLKQSCFRKYNSAKQSFQAHSDFLRNNRRYGSLFTLERTDYKSWARGLREAGYATNPKYSRLLISIIERYDLDKYDTMTTDSFEATEEFLDVEMELAAKPTTSKPANTKPAPKPTHKENANELKEIVTRVTKVNQTKMTLATGKESINQIALRTNTPAQAIVRFNEGINTTTTRPAAGERIYLQPKRSMYRGRKYSHIVAEGETMYDIAQLYGLRLHKLYARNLMTAPAQPAAGQVILLSGRRDRMPTLRAANKAQQAIAQVPTSLIDEDGDELIDWEDATSSNEPTTFTITTPTTRPTAPKRHTKPVTRPSAVQRPAPATRPEPVARPVVPKTRYTSAPRPTLPKTKQHTSAALHAEYYKVKPGDSLFAIARCYHLSIEQLKTWNELNDNSIQIGQLIRIQ